MPGGQQTLAPFLPSSSFLWQFLCPLAELLFYWCIIKKFYLPGSHCPLSSLLGCHQQWHLHGSSMNSTNILLVIICWKPSWYQTAEIIQMVIQLFLPIAAHHVLGAVKLSGKASFFYSSFPSSSFIITIFIPYDVSGPGSHQTLCCFLYVY